MALTSNIKDNDWVSVRQAAAKLGSIKLGPTSTPTFAGISLTGLTTDSMIYAASGGTLTSLGVATNGQIPIGSTGTTPVLATLTGTANEIDVTNAAGTITIGLVNPLIVAKGGTGAATLTDHGILLGSGTDAITPLGVASNGQLPIGSAGADPVLAGLTGTANQVTVTNGAGSITLSTPQDIHTGAAPLFARQYLTEAAAAGSDNAGQGQWWVKNDTPNTAWFTDDAGTDVQLGQSAGGWNGTFAESFNALVTSDGATVTLTVDKNPTGNLTERFSDGYSVFTSNTTATLTAGSDASPTNNYVYVLQSNKGVLAVSTSDWPGTEHIKVGYFLVPSAGFVQTNGVYINQNWNDHGKDSTGQGHISHMAERIRHGGAVYRSGLAGNGTDGYLTPTASNVELKATAGIVYQMHPHTVPAFDTSGSDQVLVKNWNGDAYHDITNLFDITADSGGNAIGSNKYFNLVLWAVANKSGEYTPMLINLPSGFYNGQSDAENDVSGYDDYTIPAAYSIESSTGFLIARITIKMGTTWVVASTLDLRGSTPQSASGGGTAGTVTAFADNTFTVFDESDVTKILAFQVSGVTTGNTRTLTMPDVSGTIVTSANPEDLGGVLQDLNTLGAASSDGEFIVATGAGAFAYEATDVARTSLGVGTGDTPHFTGIELGHASDTTITRASAGDLNIEGNVIYRASGTDVPIADGGTGQSTAQTAIDALTAVSGATNEHVLTKDTATGNAVFKAAAGGVDTSGTPVANDYARFTDADTIEGRSYSEVRTDLSLSTSDDVTFASLALSDQSGASVYRATSNQTLTTITWTKIQFNAETYDADNEFDSSTNYRFTATTAGRYLITSVLRIDSLNANDVTFAAVYLNGSPVTRGVASYPTAISFRPPISFTLELAINDYVEIWGWHNYGSNRDVVLGVFETNFTITKLG